MPRTLLIALAVAALGCQPPAEAPDGNANPLAVAQTPATPEPPRKEISYADLVNADLKADPGLPKTAAPGAKTPKEGADIAILDTAKGRIVVRFFPEKAPLHVANFLKLAKSGFYDGTKFHRTIPGFMIQGGDPNTKTNDRATWGMGGPPENVKAEFNDVLHTRGILSMARSQDPDSAGSQFFLMHQAYPSLDGQYTAFGMILSGMDVVDKIVSGPTEGDMAKNPVAITKITLAKWPIKL